MKQLKKRTLFVLLFAILMAAGLVIFLGLYVVNGEDWAAFQANRHVYSNGKVAVGTITDRNGTVLYDCETGTYADDATLRRATLHAVGDSAGNIGAGALTLFDDLPIDYSPIFGTSGAGNTVALSIDGDLNKLAYEALDGQSGTVALYNYKTGEILCTVSAPTYDPEDASETAAVAAGDSAYTGAYLNRFLSSTYTPGSTFKLVTAAAALENLDMDSFSYTCTGSITVDGATVTCTAAHGTQTFGECLTNSCNCAFATLALELGGDVLEEYAQAAGLLDSGAVNGFTTAAGSFTASPDGSTALAWSGVGQSTDLMNPCAELVLMGCIANGGTAASPTMLHSVTGSLGFSAYYEDAGSVSIGWSADTCSTLKWMMRDNVLNKYSSTLDFGDLTVCAKSGTAEVGEGEPHAWFVGFVNSSATPYAFVVVVEHGGAGAEVAGEIAAQLLAAACG
ncbi:MAG: penicillin-binding protein [Clostridiales bacterium]|nr:penicillin-binding protein [Clostridiales bacterium]